MAVIKNKWYIKYIQILPAPTKLVQKILEQVFITTKITQCKTSCTLKIDVFEIPDNKNIGKLLSKFELLFLNQASYSSDSSQILILQFLKPRAFLSPSPFLSNFTLAIWNSPSTPSSSCSSTVSLFCPTLFNQMPSKIMDITNPMPS